jgi:hypothetical protein
LDFSDDSARSDLREFVTVWCEDIHSALQNHEKLVLGLTVRNDGLASQVTSNGRHRKDFLDLLLGKSDDEIVAAKGVNGHAWLL